jgi:acetyl esterase/lipase
MKRLFYVLLFISGNSISIVAQQQIPLYEGPVPNSRPHEDREEQKPNVQVDSLAYKVSKPTLTIFLPEKEKANGAAVIICPGGGYGVLLTKREGSDVARTFTQLGIAAIVLKYRLPSDETMNDRSIGPLQDALHAIRKVRHNAKNWNIDPSKIGIMGFSAGGHLASSAGTHFGKLAASDYQDVSDRPDFMLLINPVISFSDAFGHTGSKENLLGKNPASEKVTYFSNELHISNNTPPTFLIHSGNDVVVPVENSLAFYQGLRKNNIPAALHIYSKGEHGFLTYPSFEEWFGRCREWLEAEGWRVEN